MKALLPSRFGGVTILPQDTARDKWLLPCGAWQPQELRIRAREWYILAENRWYIVAANHWYIVAENSWYIVAENCWYIVAANHWYIDVRELTNKSNLSNIPKILAEDPAVLLIFLIVYPHRITKDVVKLLDERLTSL